MVASCVLLQLASKLLPFVVIIFTTDFLLRRNSFEEKSFDINTNTYCFQCEQQTMNKIAELTNHFV